MEKPPVAGKSLVGNADCWSQGKVAARLISCFVFFFLSTITLRCAHVCPCKGQDEMAAKQAAEITRNKFASRRTANLKCSIIHPAIRPWAALTRPSTSTVSTLHFCSWQKCWTSGLQSPLVNAMNPRTEFQFLWKLEIFWRTEKGCVLLAGRRTPTCMYSRAGWGLRVTDAVKNTCALACFYTTATHPPFNFTFPKKQYNGAADRKQLLLALAKTLKNG